MQPASAAPARTPAASAIPKGRFNRVSITIPGRLMLADHSEHDCVIEMMSPGDAVISCSARPAEGERIVAYIDHIGRIEGHVEVPGVRTFTLSINASTRKRDKLAAQLTWLANKHELGLPEDRRHDRFSPNNPNTEIRLDDGRRYPCRIIDLSMSGAAIEIDVRPAFGTMVILGNMRGRVVRHFQEGIAMEFLAVQPESVVEQMV